MIILAGHDERRLHDYRRKLEGHLELHAIVSVGCEFGCQLFSKGEPIEHFGFVDGISSPVFIDVKKPGRQPARWDPLTPLSAVLETCMGGADDSFGSYVVFRKLEQNVNQFAALEEAIARRLGLTASNATDDVGALIIGRHKDGRPLVPLSSGARYQRLRLRRRYRGNAVPIRQPHPQGESAWLVQSDGPKGQGPKGQGPKGQGNCPRAVAHHPRRGITYGARPDLDPNAGSSTRPESGVGLLFICYQHSIEQQFEHLQREWANSHTFPPGGPVHPGRDLLSDKAIPFPPGFRRNAVAEVARSGTA